LCAAYEKFLEKIFRVTYSVYADVYNALSRLSRQLSRVCFSGILYLTKGINDFILKVPKEVTLI
jgi:hypothetical protein